MSPKSEKFEHKFSEEEYLQLKATNQAQLSSATIASTACVSLSANCPWIIN